MSAEEDPESGPQGGMVSSPSLPQWLHFASLGLKGISFTPDLPDLGAVLTWALQKLGLSLSLNDLGWVEGLQPF